MLGEVREVLLSWFLAVSGKASTVSRGRSRPAASAANGDFSCRLASGINGLYFTARVQLTVHVDAEEPQKWLVEAQRSVRTVAEFVSYHRSVADPGGAQLDVNAALSRDPELASAGVVHARMELDSSPEDQQRARNQELTLVDDALDKARHQNTMNYADRLRTDVFSDSARARLWWLARNTEQVERLPQVGTALDEAVTATPTAQHESTTRVDRAASLFAELVNNLEPYQRDFLARQVIFGLSDVFRSWGRSDLQERLPEAPYEVET